MAGLTAAAGAGAISKAGPVQTSAVKLPRWRGFNLMEKFLQDGDSPYQERDFDFIAAFGFHYVRLPLDYRIWTTDSRRSSFGCGIC